ncbi:hypothetical protein AX769_19045 [Frondihabitans sp. PAMC 28766]|uniref:PaaI family thioesterase n=1 Tax=Frondihabitans sp. PAMC 28766 TaxID=1795630 RepID=UPI00078BB3DF|nr:PaaI family thioesterase [Frondihabitans sp. PAMC 28766]AMM21863.1 hypothetical protein AX769_19045 [Frondihabitans sp. PAMC 28766]
MTTSSDHGTEGSRLDAALDLSAAVRAVLVATSATEADSARLVEATTLARRIEGLLASDLRPLDTVPSIDDLEHGIRYFNPVSGAANPMALPLVFETEGDGILARATFDRRFEGPPGHLHGGIIALVFDEILGQANMTGGGWGMTAYLNSTYRRALPLDVELVLHARVTEIDGRKTTVTGWISTAAEPETRFAEASALFVEPRPEKKAGYFSTLTDSEGRPVEARLGRPDRATAG